MEIRKTGRPLNEGDHNPPALPPGPEVWFVAAEATPFVKVGGLADVSGELPRELSRLGVRIRICLPLHGNFALPAEGVMHTHLDVHTGEGVEPCTVHEWVQDGIPIQAYALERWFGRDRVYGYRDDGDRFAAFCLAVASHAIHHGKPPAILHLNDWHTAPLAMLVRNAPVMGPGSELRNIRTLLTIHSMEYQGMDRPSLAGRFGLGTGVMRKDGAEWHGGFNALKSGIAWADAINTVSPTYAREILRPGNGFGLEAFLSQRIHDMPPSRYVGILNRLDKSWDPLSDNLIPVRYTEKTLHVRSLNRESLRLESGLPDTGHPLAAYVGRLVRGKGIGLLLEVLQDWMDRGLQVVILGTGEVEYQQKLTRMAAANPGSMSFRCGFDAELAHRIYAGADMLLMPSLHEACGLSQQIAMRYGCLPIVRKTGGLADTVLNGYNGFVFTNWNAAAFHRIVLSAMKKFADKPTWEEMMRNAMRTDSTWKSSAEAYIRLYSELLSGLVKK